MRQNIESKAVGALSDFSVTVLGGGWIGKPLAKALAEQGIGVVATSTSQSGCQKLEQEGINSCLVALPLAEGTKLPDQVLGSDCVVICIPPGIRYGQSDYPEKIAQLIQQFEPNIDQDTLPQIGKVKTIIMLSSTAVYNGLKGSVNEDAILDLSANKVAIIHQAEQQVLQSDLANKVVLRLAGLIGYNRHPGRFFANDRVIPNPDSVINFIHQDDVVGIILAVINDVKNQCGLVSGQHVINCVADFHPTRRQFYQDAQHAVGRGEPKFTEDKEPATKCVISNSLPKLGYNFIHSNLQDWLEHSND